MQLLICRGKECTNYNYTHFQFCSEVLSREIVATAVNIKHLRYTRYAGSFIICPVWYVCIIVCVHTYMLMITLDGMPG